MSYYYHTGVYLTIKPEMMGEFKQLIKDVSRRSDNQWRAGRRYRKSRKSTYSERRIKKYGRGMFFTCFHGTDSCVYLPHGVHWKDNVFHGGGTGQRHSLEALVAQLNKYRKMFVLNEGDIVAYQFGEQTTHLWTAFVRNGRITTVDENGMELLIDPRKRPDDEEDEGWGWSEPEPSSIRYDWDDLLMVVPELKNASGAQVKREPRFNRGPYKKPKGPLVKVRLERVLARLPSYDFTGDSSEKLGKEAYSLSLDVKDRHLSRKAHCFAEFDYETNDMKLIASLATNRRVRRYVDNRVAEVARLVASKKSSASLEPYQIYDEVVFSILIKLGIKVSKERVLFSCPEGFAIKRWKDR